MSAVGFVVSFQCSHCFVGSKKHLSLGRFRERVLYANKSLGRKGARLPLTCRYKDDFRPRAQRRPFRMGSLLKRELADLLQRYSLLESRNVFDVANTVEQQTCGSISVVRVDVSPDLRNAKVFVSVIGNESQKMATLRWLREERKTIKYELAQRVREIRYMPEICFQESALGETLRTLDTLDRLSEDPRFVPTEKAFWEDNSDSEI
eukprot:jgi/Galph1/3106/GphlegSOOS_G1808.1